MIKINLLSEKWRLIPGHSDYAASIEGRIVRLAAGTGTYPGRILKPTKDSSGYYRLRLFTNTKAYRYTLSRLIALTFLGPSSLNSQVHHINGIKTDDRLKNLEYIIPKRHESKRLRCPLCNHIINKKSKLY